MLPSLKINTALFICVAFVFRLLFVNIGLISSVNVSKHNNCFARYFSETQKRRRSCQESVNSSTKAYKLIEALEEDSDSEETMMKATSPTTLSIFYSFLTRIIALPKLDQFFDLIKCDLYPKKYLSLSILRI